MQKIMTTWSFWGLVGIIGLLLTPFTINTVLGESVGVMAGVGLMITMGLFPLEVIGRLQKTAKGSAPNFYEFLAISALGILLNTVYMRLFFYIFN